ncbi:MAG: RNA pseudouridine synthase [Planctomycetaceae bacterium]|nr:MAG: RNA pseudouridine synthase [Planctomycetaceae bacterium]
MTPIPVLWRCPIACVVSKPAGLATQAAADIPSLERRLIDEAVTTDGTDANRFETPYLALPHRLDRCVGGVILVARSKRAARLLGQQFETRKVSKSYVAWVEGEPISADELASSQGGWVTWRDRLRKLSGKPKAELLAVDAPDEADAKEAITLVRIARRRGGFTLLEMRPQTGRMHQLRVQTARRGAPIVGDRLYEARENAAWQAEAERIVAGGDAIALHAVRIGFHDPSTSRWVEVDDLPSWGRTQNGSSPETPMEAAGAAANDMADWRVGAEDLTSDLTTAAPVV